MEIKPDGVLVVRAPFWVGSGYIKRLIEKKKAWITAKRKLFSQRQSVPNKDLSLAERKILLKKAQEVFSQRVAYYSSKANSPYKRIRISQARSRWGSCGAKGNLNFSWRLIMAPLEVIDYVVAHEVAHLKIKNHSKHFWLWVEQLFPDYRQQRKWLKTNGHLLGHPTTSGVNPGG